MATSASWLQQWPDWASQTAASSQCRRLNAEASQAPTPTLSPALGPSRDRQSRTGPPHTRELCGQAPPGERCLFTLALQTLPMLPPRQAGTATCPQGPGWTVPKASPGPAPVCVCVCVWCYLSPRPWPGTAHAQHVCTHWARDAPWSSCLSWTLCKHFCACWVGARLRDPAPSLWD